MRLRRGIQRAWVVMNPWRPVARDCRGRYVPLYPIAKAWSDRETLPRPAFDRIRSRLLEISHRGMGAKPKYMWSLAAVFFMFFLILYLESPGPPLLMLLYMFIPATYVWCALTYGRRIPKVAREELVRTLLAEGRCPSCAYSLSSAAGDDRARTTCPECGAAWVVPLPKHAQP